MSYNSLLSDANLVGRWQGDANNDATGDPNDSSGSGNNLSWVGTAAYGTAPTGIPGVSFSFSGSSRLTGSSFATLIGSNDASLAGWVKPPASGTFRGVFGFRQDSVGDGDEWVGLLFSDNTLGFGSWAYDSGHNSSALTASTWYHIAANFDVSASTSDLFVNGTSTGTPDTSVAISTTSQQLVLGAREASTGALPFSGEIADVWLFARILTGSEISELNDGPEPTYTSGATLSDAGVYSVGTWDSYSNGTVTYEVLAANAAGTVVDSTTGSGGTLDISSEAGNTVYLLVRATNDGGYDIGDKATRTSAYGSSNDGYYELASVVAAGGGGGLSIPVAKHHYEMVGMC